MIALENAAEMREFSKSRKEFSQGLRDTVNDFSNRLVDIKNDVESYRVYVIEDISDFEVLYSITQFEYWDNNEDHHVLVHLDSDYKGAAWVFESTIMPAKLLAHLNNMCFIANSN